MRKNEDKQAAKLVHITSSILVGGVLALGICLGFLFLCSVGISGGWLSDRFASQYTIGGCMLGGLCGAMLSVRRVRAKTLIVGALTSFVQFLLILTIGILLYSGISLQQHGAGIAAGCFVGGAIAGFLGGKPKKPKKNRRK